MTDWIDDEAKKLDEETRADLEAQRLRERQAAIIAAKGAAYVAALKTEVMHIVLELNTKVLGGEARFSETAGGFDIDKSTKYPHFSARSDYEDGRDGFTVVVNRTESAEEPVKSTSLILVFEVDDREELVTKNYRTGRVFTDVRELASAVVKHAYKGGEF